MRSCLKILFLLAFSVSIQSFAGIEITDVNGASNTTGIEVGAPEDETEAIYGGTAGSGNAGSCATADGSATCSNCEGLDFTSACNSNRIYGALVLEIRFTSDSTTGNTVVEDPEDTQLTLESGSSSGSVSQGTEHIARVLWSNVCSRVLDISSTCEEDGSVKNITVGVDGDGDGKLSSSDDDSTEIPVQVAFNVDINAKHCDDSTIDNTHGLCNFTMFPGDGKAFIDTLQAPSGFPTGDGIAFHKARFYFLEVADGSGSDATFNNLSHASDFFDVEIEKKDDGSIETDLSAVDQLNNGSEYFFRMASIDLAENVGYITPFTRSDTSTNFHTRTIHSVTPSVVTALLEENFQCFIATAAFGSPFEGNVSVLREFRNKYLSTHSFGRAFVKFYYQVSPKIAQSIARRPWARKLVRFSLFPAVVLAQGTLKWGWGFLLLIISIGMMSVFGAAWLLHRRKLQKQRI